MRLLHDVTKRCLSVQVENRTTQQTRGRETSDLLVLIAASQQTDRVVRWEHGGRERERERERERKVQDS